MEFQVLGPLQVLEGGVALPLGGPRQRALLAIMVINAGQVLPADRLIDLIWGEDAPETAANALHVYVSQLRRALEPEHAAGTPYTLLASKPSGYVLQLAPGQLDVDRFDNLVENARQAMEAGAPDIAARTLRRALALWRGPPLADVAGAPFAFAEVARLNERRLRALEERIDADLALGLHADLVGELQALTTEHPLRERPSYQLMLALYHSGRQAEASDHYQHTRGLLVDQLGLEPGPMLQRLLTQILKQDPALEAAPAAAASRGRTNLPAGLTPFVGRGREIDEVASLLARSGLVTLTGAGGIGKTRLGLEVASRLADEYPGGAWLVELAPLTDARLVPRAVMSTLGLHGEVGVDDEATLVRYFASRRQLLLLDNCEHLIAPTARLVTTLRASCSGLHILVTSRELLGLAGENAWRVPSLSIPGPSAGHSPEELSRFEAVELFCDCAGRAGSPLRLTAGWAADVVRICETLEGIPLAIELAASRLNVLSVRELSSRLADGTSLLTSGSRATSARHQTLEATIAWSYELLTPPEQRFFRGLSVFAGGFTLAAAEAVCGGGGADGADVLDLMARLVDKSLVLPAEPTQGPSRFRMLELLRQFGRDRLLETGETSGLQDRHCDYYAAIAEEWSARVRGPEQVVWFDRFERDHDNIRAALARARAGGPADSAVRLLAATWLFWYVRGHNAEGLARAREVLAEFDLDHPHRGNALVGASHLAWHQRDVGAAEAWAVEALAFFEREQDPGGAGVARVCLGNARLVQDDVAGAQRAYQEALVPLRAAGNDWGASIALNNLGSLAIEVGRYDDAERDLTESLECGRRIADPWRLGMAFGNLADLFVKQGRLGRAAGAVAQCLVLQRDGPNLYSLEFELEVCSWLAAALSHAEAAARFSGAAAAARRLTGAHAFPSEELEIQRAMEATRRALGPERAHEAWQQGLEMSTEDAIDDALTWLRDLPEVTAETRRFGGP